MLGPVMRLLWCSHALRPMCRCLQLALLTVALLRLLDSCQVRCVEKLLKAGAGMTREQLTLILTALPTLDSPKVGGCCFEMPRLACKQATTLCYLVCLKLDGSQLRVGCLWVSPLVCSEVHDLSTALSGPSESS